MVNERTEPPATEYKYLIPTEENSAMPPHAYWADRDGAPAEVRLSNAEWKQILSPDVYEIARMAGTEGKWSSRLNEEKRKGLFKCAACGVPLFLSDAKFESGCGWPSFFEPLTPESVTYHHDDSRGRVRTEVRCRRCDAHIGHVFDDGPPPTRKRYCINGVSMVFNEDEGKN